MLPATLLRRPVRLFDIVLLAGVVSVSAVGAVAEIAFNRDIRPILSDNCFACHGFDSKKRKGGLRLDIAEGAFTPNKDGRVAIKPGDPKSSELWKRLETTDPDDVMPPPDSHKTLTAAQKEMLKRWIEEGAKYQKHWAFEAPHKPSLSADGTKPGGNPIDILVGAKLSKEHLALSSEADRHTLARRLSFDLRGLPPTTAELDSFIADKKPGSYERMVDRFLDSPQYGEHMARHWLDVARYADTHGLHLDNERQMWAYRDWVVKAFNRNLPYNEFTIEQLAGDLLKNPSQEQLVATGFNRNNVTTSEGGAIDAEFVFRYAVDRTATTVQAWMGLTAGCAVCHDHKFDPISQKEFYSMYAFFHSAADPAMDGNALRTPPVIQLKTPDDDRKLADFDKSIRDAEAKVTAAANGVSYVDPASLNPPPAAKDVETVWFDDDLPAGAKPQNKPALASRTNGPVFSGALSLKQTSGGLTQDVFESLSLDVPRNGKVFVHVYLVPTNAPKLVMLQFYQGSWEHRAVWGDADATEWGEKGKASRQHAGPLPATGEWVRLEFEADKLGLKPGEKITGVAYTEVSGSVYWDKAGIIAHVDPANDSMTSLAAWTRQYEGKEPKELPENVRKIFKDSASTNRSPEQIKTLRDYYVSRVCADTRATFDPLHSAVAEVRKQRDQYNDAIPQTFTWRDMEKPRDSFIMVRGQYDKPGEQVTRATPAVFPALKVAGPVPNRLDLANWLMSDEHPLTARVTVNRFWQQFFGIGLVKTSDDFGSQGEPPINPELLDWLAVSFRESGWDVKGLVRQMVTSAAYRQSSRVSPELLQRDPENRLVARGPRFRLDAEQLRDNALFVSGLMDMTMGGKGVRPYQPPNIWEPVGYGGSNTRFYKADTGSALYRRSLYTFFKRTAPAPFMTTFDAPNREQSCTRRERSNTPLQALQLLNDVQHFEAARALAVRMMTEGGLGAEDRIQFAYRSILSRSADSDELGLVSATLNRFLIRYQGDGESAKKAVTFGDSKPPAGLPETELAAYTLTANMLLNLDETITRN